MHRTSSLLGWGAFCLTLAFQSAGAAQPIFLGDTLPPTDPMPPAPSTATLTVAIDAEPASLNVLLDPIEPWGQQIGALIYDSLAQPDPESFVDMPHLASSWTLSDDRLTLTFFLRPDKVWDDGSPFTADDVVFTFETLQNSATRASTLRTYLEPVLACEKIDTLTVRFHLKRPHVFAFAAIAQTAIFPKHIFEGGDFNNHPANRAPVGLNRFRLGRWKSGDSITLVRNDRFGEAPAGVAQIVFKVVPDAAKRLAMLRAGTVDVIERMTPSMWLQASADTKIAARFWRLRHVPSHLQALGWNRRRPFFARAQVRRALTMLIDRGTLVRTLRDGVDTIASSWFYPGVAAYNQSLEPWPYAPTGARALLTEAGWEDHDGDGLRDQAGVPFIFELLYPEGNALYTALAAYVAASLGEAQIMVKPVAVGWETYLKRLADHGFDACMFLWQMAPNADPYPVWHSTAAAGGENFVNFADPEADAVLEEARQTLDADKRNALYQHLSAILHREEPSTLLFNRYTLSLVSKRFAPVVSSPYGVLRFERFALAPAPASSLHP